MYHVLNVLSELRCGKKTDYFFVQENLPDPSLLRILKMNSSEWLYIVIGCFAAIINGGVQPAYAIVFSEILGVSIYSS